MSEIKLLPCPFCGSDKVDFWETDSTEHPHQIICLNCFNGTDKCRTEEDATRRWNTRKPMERIVERLEENYNITNWDKPYGITLDKAIEIVKEEGGIE